MFLPACKSHIEPLGNVEELLKELDTFCLTYQHVEFLYTLFKYRFSAKFSQKVDMCLITCNEKLTLITETGQWTECRALQKRLFCEKFKKHLFSSFQKTKTTQTSGSVFVKRIEHFKKTKFELELIKVVDCFHDSHGIYDGNLASFKMKYFKLTIS